MLRVMRRLARGRHWPAFAAAALAIGTLLSFTQYDGYRQLGGNLLTNGDFSGGLDHWHWRGGGDAASGTAEDAAAFAELRNRDPVRATNLWQTVSEPGRFSHVSVALELLLEDVVAGQKAEHQARIVVASYDSAGTGLWHHPHIFVVEDGSHGWKPYRVTFPVGGEVLQFFAHGRSPALQDIAINAIGAFAGSLAVLVALRLAFFRAELPKP